jgi:hypothetical protein
MEDGAIMPYVDRFGKPQLEDVCREPVHRPGPLSESLFGGVERGLGNVDYGQIVVATLQQTVDQPGGACPNVQDSAVLGGRDCAYQLKSSDRLRLKPAHSVVGFADPDLLPMRLWIIHVRSPFLSGFANQRAKRRSGHEDDTRSAGKWR